MSALNIQRALEIALAAMTPALSTAWDGDFYEPTAGDAFQKVKMRLLKPDNSVISKTYYQERGSLLIELHYPLGKGSNEALTRAGLIRTTFARGNSFTNGGITVNIVGTPEIGQPREDTDYKEYIVPVMVPFKADIFI